MRLFVSFFLFLLLSHLSCISDDLSGGGGTDIANATLIIKCHDFSYTPQSKAEVVLTGVILTSSGDSSFFKDTSFSDDAGKCTFKKLPSGVYTAVAKGVDTSTGAILGKVKIPDDSIVISDTAILRKRDVMMGRVVNYSDYSNLSVTVPGTGMRIKPDFNGFYNIPGMYKGFYYLCFISNDVVNYISLNVDSMMNDTIFIRDIKFTENYDSTQGNFAVYEDKMISSYQITPVYYAPQEEPAWYSGKNFNNVDYITVEDKPLVQWRLPIMIGITDSTLNHFGGDSTVMLTLINSQIKEMNDNFNNAEIDGKIQFAIDSVYFFDGTNINSEKSVALPSDYSLTILYDIFQEGIGTLTYWHTSSRVLVQAFTPQDSGGVFGARATRYLTAGTAWSRGAYFHFNELVEGTGNLVNGDSYSLPSYVQTTESADNWSSTNSMIMNFVGKDVAPVSDISSERFPDNISIQVVSSTENPLNGIAIDIFTAVNDTIDLTADYSGITDLSGYFIPSENPFININTKVIISYNLLLRVIDDTDTVYNWFPFSEVLDSCFVENRDSYSKRIVLP